MLFWPEPNVFLFDDTIFFFFFNILLCFWKLIRLIVVWLEEEIVSCLKATSYGGSFIKQQSRKENRGAWNGKVTDRPHQDDYNVYLQLFFVQAKILCHKPWHCILWQRYRETFIGSFGWRSSQCSYQKQSRAFIWRWIHHWSQWNVYSYTFQVSHGEAICMWMLTLRSFWKSTSLIIKQMHAMVGNLETG